MTRPADFVNYEFVDSSLQIPLTSSESLFTLYDFQTNANTQSEIFLRVAGNCKAVPPVLEQYNSYARNSQIAAAVMGQIPAQDFVRFDLPISAGEIEYEIGGDPFPPGWEGQVTFTDGYLAYQWAGYPSVEKPGDLILLGFIGIQWTLDVETDSRTFNGYVNEFDPAKIQPGNGDVYFERLGASLGTKVGFTAEFTTVKKIDFNYLLVTMPQCMFSGFPADKSTMQMLNPDDEAQRGNYAQMPIEKQSHLANNALVHPYQLRKG